MGTIIEIGKKQDPALDVPEQPRVKRYAFRAYARLSDMNSLQTASSLETLHFFFLSLENPRVNQELIIVDNSNKKFTLISREEGQNGASSYIETICPISREMFVSLRKNSVLGYKARLYKFPVLDRGDLFWEVMTLWGNDGKVHPWVVISCEHDDDFDPTLPFSMKECIIESDGNNTIEENEFITSLWEKGYSKIDESDVVNLT